MTVSILFTITDPRFDDKLATESVKILRRAIELLRDGEASCPAVRQQRERSRHVSR